MQDDKDFDIHEFKRQHNAHFRSPEHVSKSKFKEFFGTRDLGTKIHFPAAGAERDKVAKRDQQVEQKIRSQRLRNEAAVGASKENTPS